MQTWLAEDFLWGAGRGGRQIVELLAAFALTALIGLERSVQGKSAGLRTQSIVGTAAALLVLVSKFGFSDVVTEGKVVVDPSAVAAQIVVGIGFLGAGIIITRSGAVHGLTTAAAVWESAAIGMAAGAGMLMLAIAVVALHFVSTIAFDAVERRVVLKKRGTIQLHVIYEDRAGVLRGLLMVCGQRKWELTRLEADHRDIGSGQVGVMMTMSGAKLAQARQVISDAEGVVAVIAGEGEDEQD